MGSDSRACRWQKVPAFLRLRQALLSTLRIVWPSSTLFAGRRDRLAAQQRSSTVCVPRQSLLRHPRRRRKFSLPAFGPLGIADAGRSGCRAGGVYVGQEVFLPVVLAILLAFVLAPFVDVMRKWHWAAYRPSSLRCSSALWNHSVPGRDHRLPVSPVSLPTFLAIETTIESKVGSLREGTPGKLPALLKISAAASIRPSPSLRRSSRRRPPPSTAPPAAEYCRVPCRWKSIAGADAGPDGQSTLLRLCSSRWQPRASCSWC